MKIESNNEKSKIIVTNYDDGTVDLNILGNHFDGNHVMEYKIINDGGDEYFIIKFMPFEITKKYEKK